MPTRAAVPNAHHSAVSSLRPTPIPERAYAAPSQPNSAHLPATRRRDRYRPPPCPSPPRCASLSTDSAPPTVPGSARACTASWCSRRDVRGAPVPCGCRSRPRASASRTSAAACGTWRASPIPRASPRLSSRAAAPSRASDGGVPVRSPDLRTCASPCDRRCSC